MAFARQRARLVCRLGPVALLLVVVVAGCGQGRGSVSGRVLYNGAPLPGGRVTFRPADSAQNTVSVELDKDGNYQAVLPTGAVKVCVDNRELEPVVPFEAPQLPPGLPPGVKKAIGSAKPDKAPPQTPQDAPHKLPGKYVPIPEKYYSVDTSGLQFTVEGGNQKHDITLTK
jgi:hypothetical protein